MSSSSKIQRLFPSLLRTAKLLQPLVPKILVNGILWGKCLEGTNLLYVLVVTLTPGHLFTSRYLPYKKFIYIPVQNVYLCVCVFELSSARSDMIVTFCFAGQKARDKYSSSYWLGYSASSKNCLLVHGKDCGWHMIICASYATWKPPDNHCHFQHPTVICGCASIRWLTRCTSSTTQTPVVKQNYIQTCLAKCTRTCKTQKIHRLLNKLLFGLDDSKKLYAQCIKPIIYFTFTGW